MALEEYKTKRAFDKTPEPEGGQAPDAGPLRFVVQRHDATRLHYDFRLEMGGVLKSWAVPKGPSLNPEDKRLAVMTEDHPLDYAAFEGVIPAKQYGAGSVMVWDEGTWEPYGATSRSQAEVDADAGIRQEHLTFILHGRKLNGEFALVKLRDAEEEGAWLLIKANKDKFASKKDVLTQDRSAITGRNQEQIAKDEPVTKLFLDMNGAEKRSMPQKLTPMLAEVGRSPSNDMKWWHEIKWDGYRMVAFVDTNSVKLRSRNDQDYTEAFKLVTEELRSLEVPAIFDGEMVVVDSEGRSSFRELQNYLRGTTGQLVYYVFDLIYLDGFDLTSLPLYRRREILRRVLPKGAHIRISEAVPGQGEALFETAKNSGLEGLVAKRADSVYRPGKRSDAWLKLKISKRQEAIVVGFTKPRGGRQYFGALVLGVYDGAKLVYVGHAGTGFDDETLKALYEKMWELRQDESPVYPRPKTNEEAVWVRPEIVVEVEFSEWTEDGLMRQPVYLGIRTDKTARDVTKEEARVSEPVKKDSKVEEQELLDFGRRKVKFSNRSKVFWPDDKVAKGDLLDYYLGIAPTILKYLKDRPESMNRFPNGIEGESFYQKNVGETAPSWAKTETVHSESGDEDVKYLICSDEATMAFMVNLGCIEFNPWNSRVGHLDRPDWCVIDLDPEDIGFEAVIETALAVKDVLDDAGVMSVPKTSGATGMHIYVPLGAKYDYDQSKMFGQVVAKLVNSRLPKITSVERMPSKRQGRVYLDYLQNRRGQTLASAYSVRPRPHATVSTPLNWDEVRPGLYPHLFTIKNMPKRLDEVGDLFAPVIGRGISLEKAIKNLS
jgi:bifunctional non-homologous end joining protein LigD